MANIEKKSLDRPDEVKTLEKMKIEAVSLEGLKVHRVTVEPGWRWSKHVKPLVGGESCRNHHLIHVLSGRMRARMDDGQEEEFGPGDVAIIPPGHDGWNIGEQPVVWIEIPH